MAFQECLEVQRKRISSRKYAEFLARRDLPLSLRGKAELSVEHFDRLPLEFNQCATVSAAPVRLAAIGWEA